MKSFHYHVFSEENRLVRCWHYCRNTMADWGFWLGLTIGFPIEHFLWEKLPPFSHLTKFMGL